MHLRDVIGHDDAGRKAQTLARMLAVGLPVLDGIVVLPTDPPPSTTELVATLGPGPYAVRSSSPLEDGHLGSAAGLYDSLIGVGAPGVATAIATVRASAHGEAVRAYLAARGREPMPIAVLVQRAVGDVTLGVARSITGGFLVEERAATTPEWSDVTATELSRGADARAILFQRIEEFFGHPVDVEYAHTSAGVVVLQARPVAVPRAARDRATWPPGRWRLDAEHNPDPISRAQQGLVELVDGRRFGPRARVIGGYLYVREDHVAPVRNDRDAVRALVRFTQDEGPALRAELIGIDGAPLAKVLTTYCRVMRTYAREIRPGLGVARETIEALLRDELGERLADHGRLLGGTGGATIERDTALYELGRDPTRDRLEEYLARFGSYAPAWDVAIACDDEDPRRVLQAAERRALGPSPRALAEAARVMAGSAATGLRNRLQPRSRDPFDEHLRGLRALVTLAESDDLLFFEGQRSVRRALLACGSRLVATRQLDRVDDVFDVSLADLLDGRGSLVERAAEGHASRLDARHRVPPYRIVDGVPHVRLPDSTDVLKGRPGGGRARGRAVVMTSLTQPIGDLPPGAVLVVPAALPSLAPHLPRLAALVTEHGGALSHAATLARESGVAAVVGVAGALQIPPGAEIYVDGERGRVLVLRTRS